MRPFPLENALCNGGYGRVVSSLDVLQKFRELCVIMPDFWWPDDAGSLGVIPGMAYSRCVENKNKNDELASSRLEFSSFHSRGYPDLH